MIWFYAVAFIYKNLMYNLVITRSNEDRYVCTYTMFLFVLNFNFNRICIVTNRLTKYTRGKHLNMKLVVYTQGQVI